MTFTIKGEGQRKEGRREHWRRETQDEERSEGMTVSALARYFSDRKFFVNPDQKVRFVLSLRKTPPSRRGAKLEIRGSVVPERGEATVAFWRR